MQYIYMYQRVRYLYQVISHTVYYVGLAHTAPPTNTQVDIPYTNTYKHRTSYFKSKVTFLGPAKWWKSISAYIKTDEKGSHCFFKSSGYDKLELKHQNLVFF